jgi:transcriptional regulator with XRE-family HTH domain
MKIMKKTSELGRKVRTARVLRGYSQENIANELGIRQQTYQLIENGVVNLTQERFGVICKILKMEEEFVKVLDDIDLLSLIISNYLKTKERIDE